METAAPGIERTGRCVLHRSAESWYASAFVLRPGATHGSFVSVGRLVRGWNAVLAGRAFLLGDGSLLLLAVAEVRVDGQRLEGVGFTPTIDVPLP